MGVSIISRKFFLLIHCCVFAVFFTVNTHAQSPDSLQIEKQVADLNTKTVQLLRARQYTEALPLALQAVDIAEHQLGKQNLYYATSMNWLGGIYANTRELDKAESCYREAIDWRAKTVGKDHRDYARPVYNLAMLYMNAGDYDRAEPLFLEAIRVIKALVGDQHPDYAIPANGLATLYMRRGNFTKAEPLNLAIRDIRLKTVGKTHPDYAQAVYNLGILWVSEGRYLEAEPLLIEAKDIQEKATGKEHPDYAKYLNGLANLYILTGNYNKVEPMYMEALAIQEKTIGKMHIEYIMALGNLGTLYLEQSKNDRAKEVYQQAIDLAREALPEGSPYYPMLLSNLATALFDEADFEQSNFLLESACAVMEKTIGKSHPQYITAQAQISQNYYELGEIEQAIALNETVKKARLDIFGKNTYEYYSSTVNLAIYFFADGRYQEAIANMKESNEIKFNLLASTSATYSESQMAAYMDKFAVHSDVLYSFAQLHPDTALARLSFDNALFFKGFLLDNCRYLARAFTAADSLTRNDFDHWQSLRRQLAQEYAKPVSERQKITATENKAEALERLLIQKVPHLTDTRRVAHWGDVQAHLQRGTAAIEFVRYFFHEKNFNDSVCYAAIVLLPGEAAPHFIPLCEEEQLTHNLKQNKDVAYWLGGDQSLYKLLWKPIEPLLTGIKTICYSPDGVLYNINFDAIATDPQGNVTLLDKYKLVRLGSTRQLAAPAPEPAATNQTALLFGGIRYEGQSDHILQKIRENAVEYRNDQQMAAHFLADSIPKVSDLAYLPGTLEEVIFIETHLKKNFSTHIFTGFSASEETFKYMVSGKPSPRVIHIATHGFSSNPAETLTKQSLFFANNPNLPAAGKHPFLQSGLYFAGANHARQTGFPMQEGMDDGILSAYEVGTLSLTGTELVVLSACKTGLGVAYGSDGLYGLQRAFKIAGAKYLVLSLWQVSDKVTEELMSAFYANWLNKKMEIPAAFRQAQIAMKKKYKDPELWAGFVLVE